MAKVTATVAEGVTSISLPDKVFEVKNGKVEIDDSLVSELMGQGIITGVVPATKKTSGTEEKSPESGSSKKEK